MQTKLSFRGPQTRYGSKPGNNRLLLGVIALIVGGSICMIVLAGTGLTYFLRNWSSWLGSKDQAVAQATPAATWAADSSELTIAVSPVMAPVLATLAQRFSTQGLTTPDKQTMTVRLVTLAPDKMVKQALTAPGFQAISPDSGLWIDRLEAAWRKQTEGATSENTIPVAQQRTSGQSRYAVSPVVIAMWESVARDLGWPGRAIGWRDIQQKATADPNFKWNHASASTASGMLATLAEFYAGAGITRGLTEELATDKKTLDYVQAVEATVRFYGEGEEVIVARLAQEGRSFLDAFVAQERVVIEWNRQRKDDRLVAIYPAEGTLWTDHPLALLELGQREGEQAVTDNQRLVYQAFVDFLAAADAQQLLLQAGYRPADLNIALDGAGSPFANTDAVDWRQPQTTLQMPSPAVVDVVQNFFYYIKRPTNVYLVVDTSGSMEGPKMDRARQALQAFVEQIKGERDRLGVIEFGSGTKSFTPLRVMDDATRADTLKQITGMEAVGGTAVIDAVYSAVQDLQAQNDTDTINAIVVMTDGQENESQMSQSDLRRLIRNNNDTRLVIFTIAFGADADEVFMQDLADLGGGQFRRADETDIEELYRVISTYF